MFIKVCLLSAYISVHKFDIIDENLENNSKRRGICVSYKSSLLFKKINIKYFYECISFELRIGSKFELTLDETHEDKPFMTVVLGDFNAKSKKW